jgi:drug/metabolite transporter (DMT)-like permease
MRIILVVTAYSPMFLLGLAAAIVAAILFNLGIALQALEARRSPKSLSLKVGLLGHLLQRPLWLLGAALGIIGIGPQLLALAYAPFPVVQTALTAGLVLLLVIAVRYLGERVDRTALIGVALLIAGVALVSWGAPERSEAHRGALAPVLVVAGTAVVAFGPFVLRRFGVEHGLLLAVASGVGFAGANIATKLASDAVGSGGWVTAAAWGVALAILGVGATLTSMSAIQRSTATMVVPVSTAVQTFLPVVLEPLFLQEHFRSFTTQLLPVAAGVAIAVAGVVLVGRDPAVSELAAGR